MTFHNPLRPRIPAALRAIAAFAVIAAAGTSAAATAAPPTYAEALSAAIFRHAELPDSFPAGTSCRLTIVQQPGGEVVSARLAPGCTASRELDAKVELAVLRATPLPYFGYESEFRRELELDLDLARANRRVARR
jgi:colicin import membrane protein